jgi:hypothetical protein
MPAPAQQHLRKTVKVSQIFQQDVAFVHHVPQPGIAGRGRAISGRVPRVERIRFRANRLTL